MMTMTTMKNNAVRRIVILTLLPMLVLAGCSTNTSVPSKDQSQEPLKIGVLTSLTGKGTDWGKKQKVALDMVEQETNASGGINGSPVKFIIYDTGGDNQQAVILTRRLASEDKALAILGPYFSGECEVAFPQGNELKIPIISATSAKPGISSANRPWAFRNTMTDDKMIKVGLPIFFKKYPVQKTALVADLKDAVSTSFANGTLPSAMKGISGLSVLNNGKPITYNTGDTDFSAQVTTLKQLGPQALGIGGLYQEIASLAQEMKRQGLSIPALGNVGMYSDDLIKQGGDAVEGWVTLSNFWPTNPDPKVQEFTKQFSTVALKNGLKDSVPDAFSVSMYDTAKITLEIIQTSKITPTTPLEQARTEIKDGWTKVKDYKGIMGNSTIDGVGDGIMEVYALIVKNGKWERLE